MTQNEIKALKLFDENYNCSQAVFVTIGSELGISEKDAIAIAAGFGAGMCFQGNTCGAVTGSYMALGVLSSKKFTKTEDIKEYTYQLIGEFNKNFIDKHRTTVCNDLLGVDMSTEKGVEKAKETGLFTSKCPEYVKTAVQLIDKINKK
jgi:C_GCAxxG_C_C family probable redox protein